jgi:hypothetical protein
MSDRLDDLPEGNTPDDPTLAEYFQKKPEKKRQWKDILKILVISTAAFVLAGNPVTGLLMSRFSFAQGVYKNFFFQLLLFVLIAGVLLWYF